MFFVGFVNSIYAQDSTSVKPEVDPSKPTNLYTQININTESSISRLQNLYGVRINIQEAFNPNNLLLAELPVLYNSRTRETGISDIRVRYFNVAKRNLTKNLIAIAPFADVTIPVGSVKNGLGNNTWSIAGGCVAGIVTGKYFSLFPGLSYVFNLRQDPVQSQKDRLTISNGAGFQLNAYVTITKSTYIYINPTPIILVSDKARFMFTNDLEINQIIVPNKFKMNAYWGTNLTYKIQTLRIGGTIFL